MSAEITIVVSVAALFVALGAFFVAFKTVAGLGRRYVEFVESHITTLSIENKKLGNELTGKMKVVEKAMESASKTGSGDNSQLKDLNLRIAELTAMSARLEKSGER